MGEKTRSSITVQRDGRGARFARLSCFWVPIEHHKRPAPASMNRKLLWPILGAVARNRYAQTHAPSRFGDVALT